MLLISSLNISLIEIISIFLPVGNIAVVFGHFKITTTIRYVLKFN